MADNTDKLNIDLVGAQELLQRLTAATAMLDEPIQLLDAIGAQLVANINLRFETKTDAAGHAWAPLSDVTPVIWESIHGTPLPGSMLERTRRMRDSLTHNPTNDSVEVGFTVAYAGFHVTGTKRMPRRDPLFATVSEDATQGEMGAQDQQDVLSVIESFLNAALG